MHGRDVPRACEAQKQNTCPFSTFFILPEFHKALAKNNFSADGMSSYPVLSSNLRQPLASSRLQLRKISFDGPSTHRCRLRRRNLLVLGLLSFEIHDLGLYHVSARRGGKLPHHRGLADLAFGRGGQIVNRISR